MFCVSRNFVPLTAVASLFGMNLAHGLNEQQVAIFWAVAAVSLGLGIAMKSWVLAKSAEKPAAPAKKPR
jgi:Mg2+ and Co2+ transporter CorA